MFEIMRDSDRNMEPPTQAEIEVVLKAIRQVAICQRWVTCHPQHASSVTILGI
jgi:hypothetical protein